MAPLLLFLLFLQVDPFVSECHLSNDDTSPLRTNVYGNGKIIDITHRITPEMVVYGSGGVGLGQFLWLKMSIKKGNNSNSSFMKLSVHTGTHVDAPGHFIDSDFDAGFDVDNLDLDVLNGPGLLIDVPREKNKITAEVMESLSIPKGIKRVLFRTSNTDRGLMYKREEDKSFVGFSANQKHRHHQACGHRYTAEIPVWESSEGLGKQFLRLAASMKNGSFANVSEMKLSVHSGTHVDAPGHFWDNYYDAGFDSDSLDLQVLNGPALLVDVPRDKNITAEDIIPVEALKLDDVEVGTYSLHCLPLRLLGAEGAPTRCILIK